MAKYFLLDERDLEFISKKRGSSNRFGFALQITIIRFLGMSINNFNIVPCKAKKFVAEQIDIDDIEVLRNYGQRDTTKREHLAEIRKFYGYQELNNGSWLFKLNRLLYYKVWIGDERPSLLFDVAVSWLLHNKILLPGISTLERIISRIRERIYKKIYKLLHSIPSDHQKRRLNSLVRVKKDTRTSNFDNYRKGAFHVSSNSINEQIEKYLSLKRFGISKLDISKIPEIHLRNLARYTSVASMSKIARMNEEKKTATLLCFVKHYETEAIDEVLDLFELIVNEIILNAKRIRQKKRLRTLKDLDSSALILAEFCHNILTNNNDPENHKIILKEIVKLSNLSIGHIHHSIDTINDIARPSDNRFSDEMVEQYAKVRRFLPNLLKYISFGSAKKECNVLSAIQYLKSNFNEKNKYIIDSNIAPKKFINKSWDNLVFDKKNNKEFNQKAYILAFVIKMYDLLKRRDVYALNSNRWNDPRIKLLQKGEWNKNKTKICRLLGKSIIPSKETDTLSVLMDKTYKRVADKFSDNTAIKIDRSKKNPSLTIENLSKLEESNSLILLRERVNALLPKISLSELILEIDSNLTI